MKKFKKLMSILLAAVISIPYFANIAVSAEGTEKYPYMIFGRNGITMSASSNLCMNGNVHTNKEADISYLNGNINGKITTGADIEKRIKHVYADTKIRETYFTENCELYEDGYVRDEMNIHINNPIYSYRNIELDGNVALNSSMGTLMDINVTGEVKNANTSVVYSKYGDITIENDSTANINGLIYCPLGTLTIDSPNINLNGVIIADKIVINGGSVNINYKENMAGFIGTESEKYDFSDLEYLPESWLGDTDKDELFDIYEKVIDTDPYDIDTDDDGLPDGYEVLTLNTDPLELDTDENGISDADEDFDNDNLNNLGEYLNKTGPFNPDTDEDGLLDGDEIKTYGTDPLNPDTDNDKLLDGEEGYDGTIYKKYGVYFDPLNPDTNGNGILDGDEVYTQSKNQSVETYDKAITEIKVDMDTNGSLERNLTIESMYGIDAMSSDVYAMIGEPFNFTSETSFESATITFKIDKSKLGDTKFDNLIILWYNEKEQIFEEMPTTRNWENSTVSTTTTHFSQYLIVDSEKWYTNWEASFNELRRMWDNGTTSYKPMNTIFVIDCCADMGEHDKDDQRLNICSNIVNGMMEDDRAAVITYSEYGARGITGLTDKYSALAILKSYIKDSGARSNLKLALKDALTIAHSSSSELNRIIILTNGNTQFTFELDDYDLNNVNVYIVDMGGYPMGESLKNIANRTKGSVFSIASASDLAYQCGETITTPPEFIGQDSDGDGIPDIVEDYGLKPNGEPIGTNKYLKDTDGDGLDDNVELIFDVNYLMPDVSKGEYDSSIYMGTDPTKKDTDGDGYNDKEDPNPLVKDVLKYSISHESYIGINHDGISYGSNQSWFENYPYNKYCNGALTNEDVASSGCGLIAGADVLAYLNIYKNQSMVEYADKIGFNNSTTILGQGKDLKEYMGYDENSDIIDYESYMTYLSLFSNKLTISNGNITGAYPTFIPTSIQSVFNDVFDTCDLPYNATWGLSCDFVKTYVRIEKMVRNNIPVIFSFDNGFSDEKLKLYTSTDEKSYSFNMDDAVSSHYMAVTGIIEYSDEIADRIRHQRMLEISSWGKKYYIDFDEYAPFMSPFTNILYIQ